jgi:hypothetical protein
MVTAADFRKQDGFKYAIDNGAWSAFKSKTPFNESAFKRCIDLIGKEADFIVVPDIVCGGIHSLRFSESWLQRVTSFDTLALLPVQDEMTPEDIESILGQKVGIFIGGSDHFKESTMGQWARLAERKGVYIHCGRVNTNRRLRMCVAEGIDSFDGSGPSVFPDNCIKLSNEIERLRLQPFLSF